MMIEIWKFDYTSGGGWLLSGKFTDFLEWQKHYLDLVFSYVGIYIQEHLLSYAFTIFILGINKQIIHKI